MDDIIGIIVFIIFIALRTMSDRKKGLKKGSKTRPAATPPRQKVRPVIQAETVSKEPKKARTIWPEYNIPLSPPKMDVSRSEEGISAQGVTSQVEIAAPAKKRKQSPPLAAAADGPHVPVLSSEDLRRAVLWSEILAKPRAMRKSIR